MAQPNDENRDTGADAAVEEDSPPETTRYDDSIPEANQRCGPNDEHDRPSIAVNIATTPMPTPDTDTPGMNNSKPRRWLYDRMFGRSPPPKPPSVWCYVPPCISLCPDVLEQNCLCESIGGIGKRVCNADETPQRTRIMRIGMASNFISMILTIASCFAISLNYTTLQTMSFSSGRLTMKGIWINGTVTEIRDGNALVDLLDVDDILIGDDNSSIISFFATGELLAFSDIGLRGVAFDDILLDRPGQVLKFDEFCDYDDTGLEFFIPPENCAECSDVSKGMVITLAMSVFPYIPTMVTNLIRSYYTYDINCLKSFGFLATLASSALAMVTFLLYRNQCFLSFYEGDVYLDWELNVAFIGDQMANAAQFEESLVVATVEWGPGAGLICILLATGLTAVDITCHSLIPSPSMARDHDLQEEYEAIHTSDGGVTEEVSVKTFVSEFVGMLFGKKKENVDHLSSSSAHDNIDEGNQNTPQT